MKTNKTGATTGYSLNNMHLIRCSLPYWRDKCRNDGKPNVVLYVGKGSEIITRKFAAEVIREQRRRDKSV